VGIEPGHPSNSRWFTAGRPQYGCRHLAASKWLGV